MKVGVLRSRAGKEAVSHTTLLIQIMLCIYV